MKTKNFIQKLNFYELIGIILGDGCIYHYPTKGIYGLEISGNAEEDREYFLNISDFIENLIGKKPVISVRNHKLGKSLKLVVYSKKFAEHLINDVGITCKNKTFEAVIPDKLLDWKYSKHIIRGLFETDGSLYFLKVNGILAYPRVEIKTSSKVIAGQITKILEQKSFKPHTRTNNSDSTIGIYVSGPLMLERWVQEIGFGSNKSLSKYLVWKKLGYYIPRISFNDRIILLKHDGRFIQARVPKRPKGSDVHGTLQAAKQLYEPEMVMK